MSSTNAKFATLGLVLGVASAVSVRAASVDTMPKPAPPFLKRQSSVSSGSTCGGVSSFRVQTDSDVSPDASTNVPAKISPTFSTNVPANIPPLNGRIDSTKFVPRNSDKAELATLDAVSSQSVVIKTTASQVGGSNAVPPEMFRAWLEKSHPQFALTTSTMSPSAVLEVKGIYDNSSKTLKALGIQFQQVRGGELLDRSFNGVRVLVVNCPGRLPRESFQKIRDFVSAGGYLLTTDWSSDNLIEHAFPGYIQWDKHSNKQSVYDAEVVQPDPSLFARTVTNASWKMDIDSHMIRTIRDDVRILATSKQLTAEDAPSRGALAVIFPFGRGYVLHMVSHFDNNTVLAFRNMLADPAPVIGISLRQAIAANFVVAGLSGTRIPIHQ